MHTRPPRPWPTYLLAALCVGALAAAVLVVGPASGTTSPAGRVITVGEGVVQSTVSGSGNVQAAAQLNLGFKTAGAVTQIYIHQSQHVVSGQLLAQLDPESAEVTLQQAKATLQAAEASLVQEQESDGEGAGSGGSSTTSDSTHAAASATTASGDMQKKPTPTNGERTPATGAKQGATATSATSATTLSPALREANIASARAAVKSDRLAVQNAEQALADTRLYAPMTGTIVSLTGEVGETVSASGTTRSPASGSGSASSGSGASSTAGLGRSAAASGAGESASSGGGSSGSAFAVLSDLSSMQLVVALSESEVLDVRPDQPATVTLEALEGRKLAAHVVSVASLPTSNGGVVSYDVTFALDQLERGLKPGMSATAEVVVEQAEGVNVPTSAITAGTVTVVHDGTDTRRRVVSGLAGNSSTIVLSGLHAGEQILLPVARTTNGLSSILSRLGSRAGALGGAAGGLGGGGGAGTGGGGALGGGAAFFRGG